MKPRSFIPTKLRQTDASITLEAALALPLFIAFMLALIAFIQYCLVYAAVAEAVHETAAQIATHLYPAKLLAAEAAQTKAGQAALNLVNRVKHAEEQAKQAETAPDDYAAWLPEAVAEMLETEKTVRKEAQQSVKAAYLRAIQPVVLPLIWQYADPGMKDTWIKQSHFTLTDFAIPDLAEDGRADFRLEVEYAWRVPVPFVRQVLRFRVRAQERTWIGGI
ncbi:MAG TPA: TadE family protein [Bacilli bacterium]